MRLNNQQLLIFKTKKMNPQEFSAINGYIAMGRYLTKMKIDAITAEISEILQSGNNSTENAIKWAELQRKRELLQEKMKYGLDRAEN
jgi:hypothetical protein